MDKYMNPPEEPDGKAYTEWRNGEKWVCCPYCQRKVFPVTPITKIEHLWFKCKSTKCNKEFLIDIR